MNGEDFQAWTICWKANIWFHRPISKPLKCVECDETFTYPQDSHHSNFWLEATRCSVGHRQATTAEMQGETCVGVCSTCDQNYVLDVVKGKKECRREGCRRMIRVNEATIKRMIGSDDETLEQFISLLKKYKSYECEIHCDVVEYQGNPNQAFKPPTPECDHDRKVCNACLKPMFETAIRGGNLEALLCPDPECKKPVPLESIRTYVSADVFTIYSRKLSQKSLGENAKFRWCSCGHGQKHSGGETNPEWICLSCKKRHCFICRDGTCDHLREIDAQKERNKCAMKQAASQYFKQTKDEREKQRRLREAETADKREQARTSKKCPNATCRAPIQKDGGCAHMTCKKCGTHFCWCCKVIWWDRVPLHLSSCPVGIQRTTSRASLDTSGYAPDWDTDGGYDTSLDGRLWLTAGDR
ncbi:uncharacterized protein BDR25DRAFT_365224 [Lindgomyces ingoldianus]|uniref:Uncharacterized protein n=1 Tax=Lindgomyces ingoldianus TaxID=673940 RepID=A0ACB6RGI0_9PLEO|nr:uncharacterized protein BDR25DRAFT_365224 [Lindgomyces ingoldianus]KAF2478155.1 hypothetical protein BDR25DRAFT_365224 [Lindgomyces ingoldianus]